MRGEGDGGERVLPRAPRAAKSLECGLGAAPKGRASAGGGDETDLTAMPAKPSTLVFKQATPQVDVRAVMRHARGYSHAAIERLAKLMDGKGGKAKVYDQNLSKMVEVDVVVPPAVQVRAAELLLEKGFGKSPQALLVTTDEPTTPGDSPRRLTVLERIALLRQAMTETAQTVELEASEQRELMPADNVAPVGDEDPRACI